MGEDSPGLISEAIPVSPEVRGGLRGGDGLAPVVPTNYHNLPF